MRNRYYLEDTNFIFKPNLAGERRKEDNFPTNTRNCSIIIPDPEMAEEMYRDGFNVKMTKPREGDEEDFVPEYYVRVTLKFRSEGGAMDPNIGIRGADGYTTFFDEETVGQMDHLRIRRNSVCATLSPYTKRDPEHPTLYISELFADQDLEDDHWSDRFVRRPRD